MLFNSLTFLAFFAVTYAIYIVLTFRYQNRLLLAASYAFYACWDWRFLSLIVASTVIDYCCGLGIERSDSNRRRRVLLVISLCGNLGVLFVFKYCNFFADGLDNLLGTMNYALDWRIRDIVLPVGISFYTFQTMSYTIDVFRRQCPATRNVLDFALFVSYFPQLVAGPIERARVLLPQIQQPRQITYTQIREGCWLILLGYYLKVVMADNMTPFVSPVFANPESAGGFQVLVAIYAAAFQIYGDFAGYSSIARGISKLMGIDLMVNFRRPYLAVNPSDFWQRWHISLSSWLRDYLYIPLGGSRGGRFSTYRNLMLTMLLGGLWHGAAWHFVAWGLYHGALLCGHRLLQPVLTRLTPTSSFGRSVWRLALVVGFFQLTCIGWLLFFVNSLADIPLLLSSIVDPFEWNGRLGLLSIALFAGPVLLLECFRESEVQESSFELARFPRAMRVCCYVMIFIAIVFCGVPDRYEFIYFQF
ncbi:MAG: MBOAT family protein [Planctomycetota bacterium]|nr:MBOAT family protein [Planctomycetota bacterium]